MVCSRKRRDVAGNLNEEGCTMRLLRFVPKIAGFFLTLGLVTGSSFVQQGSGSYHCSGSGSSSGSGS